MKYKLTKNTKEVYGCTLYQIEALKDFSNVSKGDLGGWIEKESNLSQEGNAWVFGNAWVCGNAWVFGDAEVYGDAWVYGNAEVYGDAMVYGNARVYGNAEVYGNARVCGNAEVYGKLKIEAGCFFGMRYNQEEIKYKKNEGQELIYKGEAKFGDSEDEEVEKAIKLLEAKGRLKDGKILS